MIDIPWPPCPLCSFSRNSTVPAGTPPASVLGIPLSVSYRNVAVGAIYTAQVVLQSNVWFLQMFATDALGDCIWP